MSATPSLANYEEATQVASPFTLLASGDSSRSVPKVTVGCKLTQISFWRGWLNEVPLQVVQVCQSPMHALHPGRCLRMSMNKMSLSGAHGAHSCQPMHAPASEGIPQPSIECQCPEALIQLHQRLHGGLGSISAKNEQPSPLSVASLPSLQDQQRFLLRRDLPNTVDTCSGTERVDRWSLPDQFPAALAWLACTLPE